MNDGTISPGAVPSPEPGPPPGAREPAPAATAAATGVPLVEMRDIHVAFGGVHAVEDVTIDLRAAPPD